MTTSLLLSLQRGLENIARTWITTVPTIFVIASIVTLFHGLLIVRHQAKETLDSLTKKFSFTVYLKDSADRLDVNELIASLERRSDVVKPVIFTSKEQAWSTVSKIFALDADMLKKYRFSLPASITITPTSPRDATQVQRFITAKAPHLLREVPSESDSQNNLTNQVVTFIEKIQGATVASLVLFLAVFGGAGALLIGSAIHLAMGAKHREMLIMKLIGAEKSKIATPYIIEGLLLAALAFILHLIFIGILPLEFSGSRLLLNALLGEFAALMLLGFISSKVATFLYLRTTGS